MYWYLMTGSMRKRTAFRNRKWKFQNFPMEDIVGSQTAHDYECGPCSKEYREIQSVKYCAKCKEYLCSNCVVQHGRFPLLSDHSLTDVWNLVSKDRVHLVNISFIKHEASRDHEITGICCVRRNDKVFTIFSSWYEKKLFVLDASYNLASQLVCPDKAYSLSVLPTTGMIAVTLRNIRILQIYCLKNDGTLQEYKTCQVPKSCRGITAFSDAFSDSLVIVNGGQCPEDSTSAGITVYSVGTDNIAPTLSIPAILGSKELMPRHVAVNKSEGLIYFTDVDTGVLCMNRQGNIKILIATSNTSVLRGARGLCLNDDGHIFVSGTISNNVVKYSPEGTLIGEIANYSHGIKKPLSLCYDHERRYLWIGCGEKSNMKLLYVQL